MNKPALFPVLLALLFAAADATAALQLGQLTATSRLGEPLSAQVALYGTDDPAAYALDLRADIRAARGSAERRAVASISARIETDAGGASYITLRSSAPIDEPLVRFRLRLKGPESTRIGRFALLLEPARYGVSEPTPTVRDRAAPSAAVASTPVTYGPVRSGQTLWRILDELGLTGGDTASLIARVVADNPRAFVGGDANRLQVGAELTIAAPAGRARPAAALPTPIVARPPAVDVPTTAVAPLTTSPVTTSPLTTDPVAATPGTQTAVVASAARRAETTARLAALAEKFAAIRARYEAQAASRDSASQASAPVSPGEPGVAAAQPAATPVPAPAAVTAAPPAAVPAVEAPGDSAGRGASVSRWIMLTAAAVVSLIALVGGGLMAWGAWQRRRAHGHAAANDRNLVAEIQRKAEQRLKLEDEVKRRMQEKRSSKVASNTIERIAEREDGLESLQEIENRIAHGQYAEAERMLDEVIARTPANHRAKLRLAEIYYLNDRVDEFVGLAVELHRDHRADLEDGDWQRVIRMGKVLAPERPPFSGPVGVERDA